MREQNFFEQENKKEGVEETEGVGRSLLHSTMEISELAAGLNKEEKNNLTEKAKLLLAHMGEYASILIAGAGVVGGASLFAVSSTEAIDLQNQGADLQAETYLLALGVVALSMLTGIIGAAKSRRLIEDIKSKFDY